MTTRFAVAFVAMLTVTSPVLAVSNPAELMPDPAQEARAEALGHQLRCLVCQNESVEESEADLARDLRRIIRARVAAGDSDEGIIGWMTDRYGNFVRLRPPFNKTTAVLWATPALALLVGVTAAAIARRRKPPIPGLLSDEEQHRLAELLKL